MEERFILEGNEIERHFDFNKALFEFSEMFSFDEKNERAIAIIGGTFVELAIEHVLKAFLPEKDKTVNELFEFNQPLGNFSNKINLCYSLGLIDKIVKDDLNMIRKIRNNFAHELNINFNDEKIKSLSNEMKWHKLFYAKPPDESTSRDLYQVGVLQIISHLSGVISIAREEKRKIKK